jgi:hypothetical protein
MTTTLTETATFGASVAVPATGEARTAASVQTPFQELTNRSAWTKGALNGLLVGGRVLYSDSSGSATDVFVSPITRLVLGSRVLSSASAMEAPLPGGALAAETWYYVYAYDNSGTLALETSTTAPDSALVFKSSTTTHRYLGCFRTSTGSVVLPFRSVNGRFSYRASWDTASELQALLATTGVSATDVILARGGTASKELIPPHTRMARVQSSLSATGGEATATFMTKGDSPGTTMRQEHADGIQASLEFTIETDSARTVQYALTLGSTGSLTLRVVGFEE